MYVVLICMTYARAISVQFVCVAYTHSLCGLVSDVLGILGLVSDVQDIHSVI